MQHYVLGCEEAAVQEDLRLVRGAAAVGATLAAAATTSLGAATAAAAATSLAAASLAAPAGPPGPMFH